MTQDHFLAFIARLCLVVIFPFSALNKIIGEDEVMDANSLPRVKMPNRDNFIVWDPDKIEYDPIRMGAPR